MNCSGKIITFENLPCVLGQFSKLSFGHKSRQLFLKTFGRFRLCLKTSGRFPGNFGRFGRRILDYFRPEKGINYGNFSLSLSPSRSPLADRLKEASASTVVEN